MLFALAKVMRERADMLQSSFLFGRQVVTGCQVAVSEDHEPVPAADLEAACPASTEGSIGECTNEAQLAKLVVSLNSRDLQLRLL